MSFHLTEQYLGARILSEHRGNRLEIPERGLNWQWKLFRLFTVLFFMFFALFPAGPPPTPVLESKNTSMSYYAIEVYFDDSLKDNVFEAWKVFRDRKIGSGIILDTNGVQPHITTFVVPTIEPEILQEAIHEFTKTQESFPLSLSMYLIFPTQYHYSLALAPTPTISLLQFHSSLYHHLHKYKFTDISEHYRPQFWKPYCSLVQEVPKARVSYAFNAIKEIQLPFSGIANSVGIVQLSPIRGNLSSFHLLSPPASTRQERMDTVQYDYRHDDTASSNHQVQPTRCSVLLHNQMVELTQPNHF